LRYRSVVFLLFSLLIFACSSKGRDRSPLGPQVKSGNMEGTAQDGGGGSVPQSSEAEVIAAIKWSWAKLQDEWGYGGDSIFRRIVRIKNQRLPSDIESLLETAENPAIIEALQPTNDEDPLLAGLKEEGRLHAGPRDVLLKSRLNILLDGSCKGPNGDTDASVSENKIGAEICFSINKLKRIAPSSLHKEILALLCHEYGHIIGFDEEKAQLLQKTIAENFETVTYVDKDLINVGLITAAELVTTKLFAVARTLNNVNVAQTHLIEAKSTFSTLKFIFYKGLDAQLLRTPKKNEIINAIGQSWSELSEKMKALEAKLADPQAVYAEMRVLLAEAIELSKRSSDLFEMIINGTIARQRSSHPLPGSENQFEAGNN
jgi:hypothetical protein